MLHTGQPLDATPHSGTVREGNFAASKSLLDGITQQLASDGVSILWRGSIEGTPIGQREGRIKDEEVWRAHGTQFAGEGLVKIAKVGEIPPVALPLLDYSRHIIFGVVRDVVADNPDRAKPPGGETRHHVRESFFDVLDIGAVITHERDQRCLMALFPHLVVSAAVIGELPGGQLIPDEVSAGFDSQL